MKTLSNIVMAAIIAMAGRATAADPAPIIVAPDKMPHIATVDERYQSYNVEMSELTGGAFWIPYDKLDANKAKAAAPEAGGDAYAALKAPMEPIDLTNLRLRKLAAALGPAYVRTSGTAANSVYFHDADTPPPATPEGFTEVLTRQKWKTLVDFAKAVNAEIVTSFAFTEGVRDANGRWTPDQARKLINYTKSVGGNIARPSSSTSQPVLVAAKA